MGRSLLTQRGHCAPLQFKLRRTHCQRISSRVVPDSGHCRSVVESGFPFRPREPSLSRNSRRRVWRPSLLALGCASAMAQQTTGVAGSPGATTTITGQQLPPPDPKLGGVIKEKTAESKAWWAPRVVPPKGAPNVLLIMTDRPGFRCTQHLRRRHTDARNRSHRRAGAALHQFPLHVALLTDAGGDLSPGATITRRATGWSAKLRPGFPGYDFNHPRLKRAPSVRS